MHTIYIYIYIYSMRVYTYVYTYVCIYIYIYIRGPADWDPAHAAKRHARSLNKNNQNLYILAYNIISMPLNKQHAND